MLETYSFPGNVRELKNIIERALIECGGNEIQPEHIRLQRSMGVTSVPQKTGAIPVAKGHLPLNLEAAEHELIQRAIEESNGNIAEAARLLGVNRSRIYRRFQARS